MPYGLLLIRLVLGLTLVGHGSQKLFGIFGGGGMDGTAKFFAGLGYRSNRFMVLGAGLGSFGGGLLVAMGLVTPLGSFGIAVLMVNAIATVQWQHGFWAREGGYESNLLIWTVAVGIAATGPGRFSFDHWLGIHGATTGPWWGLATAAASLLVGSLTLTIGRDRKSAERPKP